MSSSGPLQREFHLTIRVKHIEESTRFYAWLFESEPKLQRRTHSVIVDARSRTNFVLVEASRFDTTDGVIHHLGVSRESKEALLETYRGATEAGWEVVEAPHTTFGGTPLHQLWLRDPDGHRIEVYARLSSDEAANEPVDKAPVRLV